MSETILDSFINPFAALMKKNISFMMNLTSHIPALGSIMPKMMMSIMPHCLNTMLPQIEKEKRMEFARELIEIINGDPMKTDLTDQEIKQLKQYLQ